MCCHKKCISKCQISTECVPDRQINKSDLQDLQPDITLGELADDAVETECKGISFIKRVNSANNLAIPGKKYMFDNSHRQKYLIKINFRCTIFTKPIKKFTAVSTKNTES